MDENHTCKEMRSPRKGVKVQFTIVTKPIVTKRNQLRKLLSSNVTFKAGVKVNLNEI